MNNKFARLRRARKIRAKISESALARLSVTRSNSHISAQIFSPCGSKVLVSASTMEAGVRNQIKNGSNVAAAKVIGSLISERAKTLNLGKVAFDRSGFHYHGRVKALADAAREGGLEF